MSTVGRLGVNIDHVATLRQLRGTPYPDLVEAARICELAGAEQITIHLREDRRHIQDADVKTLRGTLNIPMNLEMAATDAMTKIAIKTKPDWVCLVPEKRQEVTTEGGLDIKKNKKRVADVTAKLRKAGIKVSLFIEPSVDAVKLSHEIGAHAVELHTGSFCIATQAAKAKKAETEFKRIEKASHEAVKLGLHAHAGHGFDYDNVRPVAALTRQGGGALIEEFNIGHAIVCRAALVGMERAVREMVSAIRAP
jgi:pyridoxine 5-phosphate synthase